MSNNSVFSESQLEDLEGSHVYVPVEDTDYRSYHTGRVIKVINNPNQRLRTTSTVRIGLPPFCTATNNPGKGSYLEVRYVPREKFLEVFSFEKYINSFIGHMLVRDVEYLTQEIALEVATAMKQEIKVLAHYELVGFTFGQDVDVEVEINTSDVLRNLEEYPSKLAAYQQRRAEEKAAIRAKKAQGTTIEPEKDVAGTVAKVMAKATGTTAASATADDGVDHAKLCPALQGVDVEAFKAQANAGKCPVDHSAGAEATDEVDHAKLCPALQGVDVEAFKAQAQAESTK